MSSRRESKRGVALVGVLVMITILTVLVAELAEQSTTAFHATVSERDRLKAEYLAKSGLNLTRLLIAREPDIRSVVAPMYAMLIGKQPPQLNVWDFANQILQPFSDAELATTLGAQSGVDFGLMEGLTDTGGHFEIVAIPENSMINVNNPLFFTGDQARLSIAMQLYALMGGYQSPDSPYDMLFSTRDPDGQFTNRLDIVSALIDWWDVDEQRTLFDPGSSTVANAGGEDDTTLRYADPYPVKNAPYDSLEELRLIRGIGDDFWATFVEGNPDDPKSRKITIYGSGAVNPNLAPPEVLLARLCSYVADQPLCMDPLQAMAFIMLFQTARAVLPVALFTTPRDFLSFVTAQGSGERDLYPALQTFLGADNPLMAWTPLVLTEEQKKSIEGELVTSAAIFTIQSSAFVGRARTRMTAVVNLHPRWTPPPPNVGGLPPLGVVHHYRID